MENPMFIFLALLDNRITEFIKRALTAQFPTMKEEVSSVVVLFISFVVGALGVILFFPSANVFAGQGVSLFSEQIATGIVLGGLANGIDFLSGTVETLLERRSAPKAA